MQRFVLATGLALMLTGAAQAGFDNPKALVTAIYTPYEQGQQPTALDSFYSDGLKMLFARYAEIQQDSKHGIGGDVQVSAVTPSEFDPFVSDKSYLLYNVQISDPVLNGDHAVVDVGYSNFDHPVELSLSLLKTPDGWKVDDVASLGPDHHWLLSWLLRFDPLGSY